MPIIDEKIVSMQFDNSEFDPEIKKSQKTLTEFEKSLDGKVFEKYADKLNGENFSKLQTSLSNLGNSFKSAELVVAGALMNMGAKIENFISSGLRKMTLDPVTQGWSGYADKITSVQTIMAATRNKFEELGDAIESGDIKLQGFTDSVGELATKSELMAHQMDYVNDQLDQLMSFTDETSASYQVMVNNIGKFTSQNIDLKTSVKAMEGIATWANLSGANAEQMSRAMYNISQSLGVGKMLTRDWMSIENANMATVEFKEAAIDAAVELKKLTKGADGIARAADGSIVSVSNFRDTLSKDWFTGDVMIQALNRYGGFAQEILKLSSDTGLAVYDLMYKGINPVVEGTKTLKEAMDDLGLKGEDTLETLQKLTSAEYDLGRRAFEASYESKTFGDAISYVGDAIKTGWIKSYQYIIGDYKEAKTLWTEVAEVLYSVFVSAGDVRNDILGMWKASGGRTDLVESLINIRDFFKEIAEITREIVGQIFPQFESEESTVTFFAKVLLAISKRIHNFTENLKNNPEIIAKIRKGITIAIKALKVVWNLINSIYAFFAPTVRFTKELFKTLAGFIDPLMKGADGAMDFANKLNLIKIIAIGLGAAIALPIKLINSLINWFKTIGNMTLPELWEKIKTWIGNVWGAITGFVGSFITLGKNIISGFEQGMSEGLNGLWRFITGIFTGLINIVKRLLGIHSPSKVFSEIGSFIMEGLSMGISDGAKIISNTITTISNDFDSKYPTTLDKWIFGLEQFGKVLEWLTGVAIKVAAAIAIVVAIIKFITAIETAVVAIVNAMKNWITAIPNIFNSISTFFTKAGNALEIYAKQRFKGEIIRSVGQTALMIAGSIAILAGVFIALAKIPLDNIKQAAIVMGAIVVGLGAIIAGFAILQKKFATGEIKNTMMGQAGLFGFGKSAMTQGMSVSSKSNAMADGLVAMGAAMLEIVTAVSGLMIALTLMAGMMKLWNIDMSQMWQILAYLIAIITVLSGLTIGLSALMKVKAFQEIDKKAVKKMATTLFGVGFAISILSYSWSAMAKQLSKISKLEVGIPNKNIFNIMSAYVLQMVGLIVVFSGLIAGMSNIPNYKPGKLLTTIQTISVAIGSMIGLIHLMNTIPDLDQSINEFSKLALWVMVVVGVAALLSGLMGQVKSMGVGIAYFAAIMGIVVGAILSLAVTSAILGAALPLLRSGFETFIEFIKNVNFDELWERMLKFVAFATLFTVASVILSVAVTTLGAALAIIAVVALTFSGALFIAALGLTAVAGSFILAALSMKTAAAILIGSFDQLKKAKGMLKELFSDDLSPVIEMIKSFGGALLLLGISGILSALGILSIAGSFSVMALALNNINKVMNFFANITWEMIGGMAKFALGLMTIGIVMLIVSPGILTLAVSMLILAGSVGILSATLVFLGNNTDAVNNIITVFIQRLKEFGTIITALAGYAAVAGGGLIVFGIGLILTGAGLTLVAMATLALVVNMLLAIGVLALFNLALNWIKDTNPDLYNSIMNLVNAVIVFFTAVATTLPTIIEIVYDIVATAKDVWNRVTRFWDQFIQPWIDGFSSIGKNVVQGFVDGINSMINTAKSTVIGWANDIIGWFGGKLEIHSPSLEFYRLGEYTMDGYIDGVKSKEQELKETMEEVAAAGNKAFKNKLLHSGNRVEYLIDVSERARDAAGIEDDPIAYYKQRRNEEKKAEQNEIKRQEELAKESDKTIGGALKNIWTDVKNIFSDVKDGRKTIGQGFSALFESLKKHGGTFLGDKIEGLKNMLFGEGGPLSAFSDLLNGDMFSNLFKGLDLENLLKDNGLGDLDKLSETLANMNTPDMSNIGEEPTGSMTSSQSYIFTQNNYSPKALSRLEIYRQTKRQFNDFRTKEILSR